MSTQVAPAARPNVQPTSTSTPTAAAPTAATVPKRASGQGLLLWWCALAFGGAGLAGLASLVWWRNGRRSTRIEEPEPDVVQATISTPPVPPPSSRPSTDPFQIRIAGARVQFLPEVVTFDLEIELTNTQTQMAEAIRPALALISARADQDRWSAAFHAGPPPQNEGGPIDLTGGSRIDLPARLTLRREHLHVVSLGGRPMFVAMLLLDLRWRGGLSIHRYGADFLLGTAGGGDKPGPIWLDRPAPSSLSAIRYVAPAG